MENLLKQLSSGSAGQETDTRVFVLDQTGEHVALLLPNGTKLGYPDTEKMKVLSSLLGRERLEFEAVASHHKLFTKISKTDKSSEAKVHVDINIYGPASMASLVGDHLTIHKAWLQRPDYHKRGYDYENPHFINFPEFGDSTQIEEIRREAFLPVARTGDNLMQMVSRVEASTHRADDLAGVASEYKLQTDLLPHQEKALEFMLQRESGDITERFRLWKPTVFEGKDMFVHRITETKSTTRPEEKGGGILADEMGMGKSLSILALIINTLKEGRKWAAIKKSEDLVHSDVRDYAHSTLIIVPSELLINSWKSEIEIHLGDAVKVDKYHGGKRKRKLEDLAKEDIVLTTYKTLATDFTSKKHSKSPLHCMGWFRVVLDEAHNIRRPATTFHRACAALTTRSRWCLTGTPIQNRLEDIGALFVFLKAEQFKSMARFRYYLVSPFEQGHPTAVERLVMLYDSLVLRRTKEILILPGQTERCRELRLSDEEQKQYDQTKEVLNRCIRNQVSEYESKKNFGLFHVHLQLRLLCNHGTYQKLYSWRMNGSNADTREAALVEFGLNAERMCAGCSQPRPVITSNNTRNDFVEKCAHIFCDECSNSINGSHKDAKILRHCPLCALVPKSLKRKRTSRPMPEDLDELGNVIVVEPEDEDTGGCSRYFESVGVSTKMKALVRDVKDTLDERLEHEDGNIGKTKSIIFSCWTRTLDLIGRHLEKERIEFLRIDGECLMSKRQRILDRFAETDGPRIMLMTTGTGAFGLNLTAANRVFIVELQWNPSVENQAIARAIRLRQKDKVVVTRYIMKGTVEEEMRKQQKKKEQAARAGFDRVEEEQDGS
ncbi:SNF2 family N-terminal domain-containing protein [Thelonectria olida]|uniref:SNF2 family N-terminal domain-containing protein n=1 Tax=Thelonectria olida TaxID=1576542 RepID=A0A9P9AU53_9HYPO|nr:SNF2 family N-terminal domain-containing protein [Thelonectria olida]